MLRCVLRDISDSEIVMPSPLSLNVDVDESAPADSLYAVFPFIETDQLSEIRLFLKEKLIFKGIVDEEERVLRPSGVYLRISARSMAAKLLDNEAAPCSFDHPSARLICSEYVEPFGITLSGSDDSVYFGVQNVLKGSSCWSVLRNFCAACYSCVPRIGGDGVLYLKGMLRDESVSFGGDGIRYTELSEKYKRCEEISAVRVKTDNSSGYSLSVDNPDALSRGVKRERFLNAVLTESPMRCADSMISSGAAKAYTLRLRCPECLLGAEGCRATVSSALGEKRGLYISALRYRSGGSGEYTDVILKRRMS